MYFKWTHFLRVLHLQYFYFVILILYRAILERLVLMERLERGEPP